MQAWKVVLDEDAFHFFLSRRAQERKRLLTVFAQLRNDPYQKTSYTAKDSTGRDLSISVVQPFLITFWLDAAVTEIRIVNIQKVILAHL
jgi:hypothetical protein